MNPRTIMAAIVLAALAGGGCAPTYSTPIVDARPATEAERQFEARWQASLDVLRSYRFKIDYQDRRRGLIKTEPMIARHFFEFWRHDAATNYDVLEGTLQTVYVVASVQVSRIKPDGTDYKLDVVVNRIRSDQIEAQSIGAAGIQGSQYEALLTGGDRPYDPEKGSMVSLGTDENLAFELQFEIENEVPTQLARLSVSSR